MPVIISSGLKSCSLLLWFYLENSVPRGVAEHWGQHCQVLCHPPPAPAVHIRRLPLSFRVGVKGGGRAGHVFIVSVLTHQSQSSYSKPAAHKRTARGLNALKNKRYTFSHEPLTCTGYSYTGTSSLHKLTWNIHINTNVCKPKLT